MDMSEADTPPLSSQLAAPALLERSHSESNMQAAPEPTPYTPLPAQPATRDAPASGTNNVITPAGLSDANRRGRSKKAAMKEQVLDGQNVTETSLQTGQVLNPRSRRARVAGNGRV